ncbi:MAG TPA: insulinase family protein [Candidatus Elarobacter sp.]
MSGAGRTLRAAITAALFVCAAAGGALARTAASPAPEGVLPNGVHFQFRPDPAQPAAAVALWYRAPAAGFDGARTPGLSRLAAATVAASAPITGVSLVQLVERWGGRLSVAAYPDSVSVTALVPPEHAAQTVRAMTGDFFAPVVAAGGFQLAQRDAGEDAVYRSFGAEAIEDALGASLFADGPLHDGTLGTVEGIGAVKLERVRAFADRAFRPSNAILVLAGKVDGDALNAVASRAAAKPSSPEDPAAQTARPSPAPLRREGNIVGTGLGWVGPPIAAEAEATALDFLADALFAPRTGLVQKSLAARKASATGRFVTYRNPGVFLVTISGDDAAAARPIVDKAIADAAKPMAAAAFEAARAGFVYRVLSDMETPSSQSEIFGWYAVEGAPDYAPAGGSSARYFNLVGQLTPASVAQVAAKYLGGAPGVVTFAKPAPKKKGTAA